MRILLAILAFTPFVSLAQPASADSQKDTVISLDIELRVRSEWRDGYRLMALPGETGNMTTFQRNRFGFSGGWGRMDFRIHLQDIRNYGQPGGNTQGNMGAAEAWVSLEVRKGLKAVVGRQKIDIDNGRIVGAANWANPGRFLDGVQLIRTREQSRSALMVFWDEVNGTQRLLGHHIQRFGANRTLTLLAFHQTSDTEYSAFTGGATWKSKGAKTGWWAAEAYLQAPDAIDTKPASMLVLEAGRKGLSGHATTVGIDLLSNAGQDGVAFRPLLGTNHKFYGWMDHFYLGAVTDGLINLHLRHSGPISESRSWGAVLHQFNTFDSQSLLANELDLFVTGKEKEGISWTVGWSLMKATTLHVQRQGDIVANAWTPAADHLQQWGWVSLQFTPSIQLK